MKINQIKKVMKKYGTAWEKRNTELLLSCFDRKGVYQESPLSKPYKGQKQIAKFWDEQVVKNTKKVKFKLGKCYISKDGDIGFAEWECKNIHRWKKDMKWSKDHMVGIMLLKMKGEKIVHLNEYWNTKKGK